MPDFQNDAAPAQGVQPVAFRGGPNGEQIPVYNNATPGFSGAILDAVRALAMALAPKSVTQAIPRHKQQEAQAEGMTASNSPQSTDLGNQF
jgi:hypothetical protein